MAERWGEQGKLMKPVRLRQQEELAHIERNCTTIFNNLKLYMDRTTDDIPERFQLQEKILVNALARHIVSLENVVHWQTNFSSLKDYQDRYFQSIGHHLEVVVQHIRGQLKNG